MIFNSELSWRRGRRPRRPDKKLKTYGEYVNEQINEK